MICPNCQYTQSQVVKVMHYDTGQTTRRRECMKCGLRFTTLESPKQPRKRRENHES